MRKEMTVVLVLAAATLTMASVISDDLSEWGFWVYYPASKTAYYHTDFNVGQLGAIHWGRQNNDDYVRLYYRWDQDYFSEGSPHSYGENGDQITVYSHEGGSYYHWIVWEFGAEWWPDGDDESAWHESYLYPTQTTDSTIVRGYSEWADDEGDPWSTQSYHTCDVEVV